MAVLLSDSFDRANGAIGSPEVGGPWTALSGSWIISSNKATLSVGLAGATLVAPGAVDIDASMVLGANGSSTVHPSLAFRCVDANNMWFIHGRTGNQQGAIYLLSGGTATKMSDDFSYPTLAGDTLRVMAYGPKIRAYANGAIVAHAEDPFYGNGGHRVGIRSQSSGLASFESIVAQDAANPSDWGATPQAFDGVDMDIAADMDTVPRLYKGRDTAAADESEIP